VRARVVVVGGGAIGASCFYHLVERGVRDVLLVEQAGFASGSTGRSAAVVETQYLAPDKIALCAWSMRLFRDLEREHGLPFTHHGYLRLGHTADDLAQFHRSVQLQREHGVTDAVVLEPAEVARRFPALRADGVAGALFGPSDGYVDPVRYCELLAELGRAGGGRVLAGRRLTGIRLDGGRVAGVTVGGEAIDCDVVVNAGGAWARSVGALAGVGVPVDGYRRQLAVFEPAEPFTAPVPMVMDYVPGIEQEGLYFRDDTSRRLIAGLHWEGHGERERPENPEAYRPDADWDYVARVSELLGTRYRDAARLRVTGGWAGLYPLTPDSLPVVGEAPGVPGFYLAVGGGGVGLQTSPALGAIAADLITKGATSLLPDLAPYVPTRFATAPPSGGPPSRR
jgi:sarcosine oxidase subunit beta